MDFFQVPESFENQQIDSAFDQRFDLLAEGIASFLKRSFSEWFDPGAERANRSSYPNIEAFGSLPGQANTGPVNVPYFVVQTVARQAERISTEGIGFNNFRPSLQVVVVNGPNEIGLREIQFIVRTVDENAFRVEQGPHRPVAQYGKLLDPG